MFLEVFAAVLTLALVPEVQGYYESRRKPIIHENTVFYHGISLVYFETVVNSSSLEVVHCTIYSNRKMASRKVHDSLISSSLPALQFKAKISECENVTAPELKERLRSSRLQPPMSINFRKVLGEHTYSVYPGTHWCGTGNLATSPSDLGSLRAVDACCRDHARCFDSLQPGETRHGLSNRDFYARRHCRCDNRLFRCLKELAPSEDADLIGHMYFNVLQIECFEEDLPKVCTGHDEIGLCDSYDYPGGSRLAPRYQWFPNPYFKNEGSAAHL